MRIRMMKRRTLISMKYVQNEDILDKHNNDHDDANEHHDNSPDNDNGDDSDHHGGQMEADKQEKDKTITTVTTKNQDNEDPKMKIQLSTIPTTPLTSILKRFFHCFLTRKNHPFLTGRSWWVVRKTPGPCLASQLCLEAWQPSLPPWWNQPTLEISFGQKLWMLDRQDTPTGRETRTNDVFDVSIWFKVQTPLVGGFFGVFFFENGGNTAKNEDIQHIWWTFEDDDLMVNSCLLHLSICTLKLLKLWACHTYRPLNESKDAQLRWLKKIWLKKTSTRNPTLHIPHPESSPLLLWRSFARQENLKRISSVEAKQLNLRICPMKPTKKNDKIRCFWKCFHQFFERLSCSRMQRDAARSRVFRPATVQHLKIDQFHESNLHMVAVIAIIPWVTAFKLS